MKRPAKRTRAARKPAQRSREPQHISATAWYYEFPSHLLIVHEVRRPDGTHIKTDALKLPWRLIERSRKRRA